MTIPLDERVPNRTLRAVRLALHMSQSEFAAAVRHAGKTLGEPNTCNKRLIQKWESGEHTEPRPNYKRALSSVARLPYEQLGFPTTSDMPAELPVIAVRPGTVVSARGSVNGQPTGSVSDPAARLTMALERPARASAEAVGIAQTYVDRLFVLEQHRPRD